jgi:L-asparaginase/Glu-tRNA(Gln) amidotransferase subunit D
MTPEHMFRLAQDIDRELAAPSVLGAVILHGTDLQEKHFCLPLSRANSTL